MLSTKEELEALLRTLDVWVIVFGVFVAIGVAGESIVGFIHFRKSSQLQRLQTAENLAQQTVIERLRNESASIRSDTAKAMERAAHAEQQAAESNRIAEQERLARVKIEERLAPRRIGPKEHSAFVAALEPFAGSTVVITKLGDFEAARFGDDLVSVLKEAGWNVQVNLAGMISPPVYGLQGLVNEESPAGKALLAVLRSLGGSFEAAPNSPLLARIVVGLKPPL